MQEFFEEKLKTDPDMALHSDPGKPAEYGSLSHSHLNCCLRNIVGCKSGCECPSTRGGGDERGKCECKAAELLDDNGCYSLQKV